MFTDEIALHAGDTRITVRHVGTPAHTTNDVLAWFPAQSVLFCGDLVFTGGTPFLLMGSVTGAVEALEQVVLPLGARTVVPGHGPVFEGTAPVEATLDHLRFVLDLAARGCAAGVSPPPKPRARSASAGSPEGRTRSAPSATSIAPAPDRPGLRAGGSSTSSERWPTWPPNGGKPLTYPA
jgi:glyoxylase-like metal-dependent hydrolase (beta-lactamase superfamily II)